MKKIIVLLIPVMCGLILFISCNNNKMPSESKSIEGQSTERPESNLIEPPPLPKVQPFNTVHDWLTNLCAINDNVSTKTLANFRLYKIQNAYAIYLVLSAKEDTEDHSGKDLKLLGNAFKLDESEYNGLSEKEALSKAESSLRSYLTGKDFESCTLKKSAGITIGFGTRDIRHLNIH